MSDVGGVGGHVVLGRREWCELRFHFLFGERRGVWGAAALSDALTRRVERFFLEKPRTANVTSESCVIKFSRGCNGV